MSRPHSGAVPLELAGYVERFGAAHVAELLRVRVSDLPALLAGRATLSRPALRELRRAVARAPTGAGGESEGDGR